MYDGFSCSVVVVVVIYAGLSFSMSISVASISVALTVGEPSKGMCSASSLYLENLLLLTKTMTHATISKHMIHMQTTTTVIPPIKTDCVEGTLSAAEGVTVKVVAVL